MRKSLFIIALAALSIQGQASANNDCRECISAGDENILHFTAPAQLNEASLDYSLYGKVVKNAENGKQFDVVLSIKNSNAVTCWQTSMIIPDGFSLANDELGDPLVKITGNRTSEKRHAITATIQPDGSVKVLCSSPTNEVFAGNDGEIATVSLICDGNVKAGQYPIVLSNTIMVEPDETTYRVSDYECIATVVKVTDISQLDYALYNNEVKGRLGKQVVVPINMKNSSSVTSWQTDLLLPKGLAITTDIDGSPIVEISGDRTSEARHSISATKMANGLVRILCASASNKTFADNDGEVATITLDIDGDLEVGEYPVIFRNMLFVDPDETTHRIDETASSIMLKDYTLGDVNDDGEINATDLVGLVNFLLEKPSSDNIREAADVNIDGEINATDFVREVNAIMGNVVLESPAR